MHPLKKEELIKKGWAAEEIKKAESILEKVEHHDIHFSKIVFWSALAVIIFANLIVSLVLIPYLIVLNKWVLYLTVVILAGVIGFLYNLLIKDIGHLEKKHHLLAGIIIPLLALTNMIIMVLVSNWFIADLNIHNSPHNPWILGIIFALSFITPYLIDRIRGKHYFNG
jgi:ABC-type Na+ efflux pump permease subunit